MKHSVQLTQSQGLKLTPQLQMAIKLLQYSRLELEHEIESAIESNPLLERVDDSPSEEVFAAADGPPADRDPEWEELAAQNTPGAPDTDALEWIAETRSLRTHLIEQLQLCPLGPRDGAIGEALIDSLDDDGYFLAGFGEIQSATGLKPIAGEDEIEAVLHLIQQFEPLAVAARSLSECLLLQLRNIDADHDTLQLAKRIASRHLDVLAGSGAEGLVKAFGFDAERTAQAVGLLKTLDPKPGAAFSTLRTDYLRPDYRVEKRSGRWKILALGDRRQQLAVNAYYQGLIGHGSGPDSAYLKQHLQEAKWLIKSIQTRQETLMRVVTAIVARQKPFLEHGRAMLQTLTMKELAGQLALHESTVSRACNGKYLATPHGTFELNALFRSGLADAQGRMQSPDAIQSRIEALIGAESPQKPLSDAKLEKLLATQGLAIARRTIAKYREALHIPPSHQRHKTA
jgi:RNA polymerase sigma-54 factor